MAKEKQPEEPQAAAEAHHPDEVQEVLQKLREYSQPILIGVAAALVAFLAVWGYRQYSANKSQQAARTYATAQSAEDLQAVVNDYPDSSVAPLARLALAQELFHTGQPEEALRHYKAFIDEHPEHIMVPGAELGRASSLEALNQLPQALEAYTEFLDAYETHYLRPMAVFGQARCLEQMQRFDEARVVYEDFIAAHPESDWVRQAETSLEYLQRARKAAARNQG